MTKLLTFFRLLWHRSRKRNECSLVLINFFNITVKSRDKHPYIDNFFLTNILFAFQFTYYLSWVDLELRQERIDTGHTDLIRPSYL